MRAGKKSRKTQVRAGFENPFTDVPENDWFFDDVKFVYQNGLMNGTSSTTFSSDGTTSRGMIVTILWRMTGSLDMKDEIWGYPFQDVDANAYYAAAVYWAQLNGIADDYGDNTFWPDKTITRGQMAVMLYRYAQHKGYDTTPAYVTYTVQKGDTLWAIFRKYSCTVAAIVALNGELIDDPDLIFAGWELKIPQG